MYTLLARQEGSGASAALCSVNPVIMSHCTGARIIDEVTTGSGATGFSAEMLKGQDSASAFPFLEPRRYVKKQGPTYVGSTS